MATITAEFDVQATPEKILDVIADMEHYAQWSAVHKHMQVDEEFPDGRPQRVTMQVAAVGMSDTQVLEYVWTKQSVSWTLVKPTLQQRRQHGSYAITGHKDGTSHVRYELTIDPAIPLPHVIVRQVMKKAVASATLGLKHHLESQTAPR
jgi:ribosome-associated toxin RatA of RatAB toxin-antitoxin module